jgi:hypothetical protein
MEPAHSGPLLMLAVALGLFFLAPDPLPDGNVYVRGLVERQKRREEALNRYTYDVEQLFEELDAGGAVRSRKVQRFEVFYVKGRPLWKLVAEDGRPLTKGQQEVEEKRVREKVGDLAAERVALKDPSVQLSAILERYDFRTVGREDLDGFPALVLEFQPRPGKRDLDGDAVLRALAGRIWVDEAETEVVRAEVSSTSDIKFALGIGASVSAMGVVLDFRKIEDGLWLPARVEAKAEARLLLIKGFRGRSTSIFSHYRRFEAASEEEIKAPAQ